MFLNYACTCIYKYIYITFLNMLYVKLKNKQVLKNDEIQQRKHSVSFNQFMFFIQLYHKTNK